MRDPYEVLGLGRDASEADIKSAFRRLAAQHHPDKNQGDPSAQTRFTEINLANQILSDPDKRSAYDRYGPAAFQAGGRGPGGDVVDFGGFDDIFGDILGAFGFRGAGGDRGDIRMTLGVTFEEAALGASKEVRYERADTCGSCRGSGGEPGTRIETCSACGGRGRVRFQQALFPLAVERPCSRCKGAGSIPNTPCRSCSGKGLRAVERVLKVDVPAGIEHGATRVVDQGGHRIRADKAPGNLELLVEVAPHPFFRRAGDDVVCRVPITFVQAALGGEIDVPTLEGKIKLRVPPSTQPGQVLRVRGKGVEHRLRSGRGDQLVEVAVEIPAKLTPRARELIEQLGRELGEDLQPQQQSFMEKLKGLFG
ncbi:MAG: molecular chaperone DnaJ [Myxococcales bacterium]|nr:MAG: molecular chaperone DnaJ [Myxococcales bacterium]